MTADPLTRWAQGDDAAGREFYRSHAERIARFFGRKLERDAADLVQRTFLKCLEACKAGTVIDNPRAFLLTIARNELYDLFRRRETFSPELTSLHDLGTAPSQALARRAEQRLLLEALRRIPLDDQLAIELYYWEDLAMEELAQVLGVTKSAAINRVHRARQKLRAAMEALGSEAALVARTIADFESWARSLAVR